MFDHIGLRVRDLDAAVRLYTAMLAPLGHEPGSADASESADGGFSSTGKSDSMFP